MHRSVLCLCTTSPTVKLTLVDDFSSYTFFTMKIKKPKKSLSIKSSLCTVSRCLCYCMGSTLFELKCVRLGGGGGGGVEYLPPRTLPPPLLRSSISTSASSSSEHNRVLLLRQPPPVATPLVDSAFPAG